MKRKPAALIRFNIPTSSKDSAVQYVPGVPEGQLKAGVERFTRFGEYRNSMLAIFQSSSLDCFVVENHCFSLSMYQMRRIQLDSNFPAGVNVLVLPFVLRTLGLQSNILGQFVIDAGHTECPNASQCCPSLAAPSFKIARSSTRTSKGECDKEDLPKCVGVYCLDGVCPCHDDLWSNTLDGLESTLRARVQCNCCRR